MAVFVQELKKLFRPRLMVIALVLWLALSFVLSFQDYGTLYKTMHTENYPAHYSFIDSSAYSLNLQFTDMLQEEYGPSIEQEELPGMQAQLNRMTQQILDAAARDEVFQRYHITVNPDLTCNVPGYSSPPITDETDTSSGFAPYQSEEDYYYVGGFLSGRLRFDSMDEPVYFAQALRDLIPLLTEKAALTGEDSLYYVMSDTLLYHLSELLFPVCAAAIAGLICLIPPYAILENKSRTPQLLYSTKTGRRILGYRFGAVTAGSLLCAGVGVLTFAILLIPLDLEPYYHTPIRDVLSPQLNPPGTFARDITYLELLIFLCIFLALAGLIITLLTTLAVFHQRNIVTAMITTIPGIVLEFALALHYTSGVFSGTLSETGSLKQIVQEPLILLGLLTFVLLFSMSSAFYSNKRKEVM